MLLSVFILFIFIIFSYTVARERWVKKDFDTTVKLQDHIQRRFDKYFSYFSLLGSVETTVGFCGILVFLSFIRFKWLQVLGWLMIIPASLVEVFGKIILFHPSPPNFLHRTVLPISLPFYSHSDFSYPSGHMMRVLFIATIFVCLAYQSKSNLNRIIYSSLWIGLAFLMGLTRVYLGEHWLSDVIGGLLLGTGMGLFASLLILPLRKD